MMMLQRSTRAFSRRYVSTSSPAPSTMFTPKGVSTATPWVKTSPALQESFNKAATQYKNDGYTIIKNVLDPDLVGEMREHVSFLEKRFPGIPTEHWHHLIMRNDAFWVRLVQDPRLLDLAKTVEPSFLSDNNIALFSSHYFLKPAKTGMEVYWHTDGAYWPLKPMNVVTLWVAVDDSDSENGCLRIVKGSHVSDEVRELKPDRSTRNVLGSATHKDDEIDPNLIVDLVLKPGDISVHHPNIVHGSKANTSNRRRCGLTIRYISPTTQCTDPEQPVMMMRGDAIPGINSMYRSWPKYREGYDLAFKGKEEWNTRRFKNPADEAYFARTDYKVMEGEITNGLWKFIDQLGGR